MAWVITEETVEEGTMVEEEGGDEEEEASRADALDSSKVAGPEAR